MDDKGTTRENSGLTPAAPPRCLGSLAGGLALAPLLAVVNGALAGIGSLYITTRSVAVTLIAAIFALVLGSLAVLTR